MNIPEYVTVDEVKRVCSELGIRDWTTLDKPTVQTEEARAILPVVNVQGMPIPEEDFRQGLEVELEHGVVFNDANVTNNHPVLTGKIVLAHMKESLDYYKRLEVAEIEGDLLAAAAAGDKDRLMAKFLKLVPARQELADTESARLAERQNTKG